MGRCPLAVEVLMGNIFSGSEIVEIGIQIEINGRDFYNTVLKQSKNPKAQEVFQFLAGEEEKHIKVFQGILEKIEKYEPQGLDVEDYYSYMNALASEHIFTKANKGEELAKQIKNDLEAIDKGIRFEEDSIVFYEGMKKAVLDYEKKTVDALIAQEQNHLRQLVEMKKLY
jgi:rubrerythrin